MKGELGNCGCRHHRRDERGQVVVLFALLVPVLLALSGVVLSVGNWYVHAKQLQTKVDAAAFAGGASWGFPCGADIDSEIEAQARMYVGSHTAAPPAPPGTVVTSPYNPQLSGVGPDRIYASLNQAQWWSGSFPAADFSDPLGPVCESKILDVKATLQDPPLIGSILPFFPDIKRKARVRIEEISGLTGLLPIAVRLPQPLSTAAVFYNEKNRRILDVKPFRQICIDPDDPDDPDDPFDPCIAGAPPGLGQWTTEPELGSGDTLASFEVAPQTGVVIATSVRPLCGVGTPPATQPCMDMDPSIPWTTKLVDDFCAQASNTVRCYDDIDGGGPSSTVSEGVHFLLGHPTGTVDPGPVWPEFRGAWLGYGSCTATVSGYFNSNPGGCAVELNVRLDAGSCMRGPGECFDDPLIDPAQETRRAGAGPDPFGNNIQVRYCLVQTGDVGDVCESQFSETEELTCSGSASDVECVSGPVPIAASSRGNAFALEVRLRNTVVTGFPDCQSPDDFKDSCRFFLTGEGFAGDSVRPLADEILDEPIQRSFMGDLERTTPVRWVRLTKDNDCDPETAVDRVVGHDYGSDEDAASQPANSSRCFLVDLGVAGGLARDQDEPPIAFNLGDNSSQRAFVDCDPNIQPDPKEEIVKGCQWPPYAANKFASTPYCPSNAGFFDPVNPPMAGWPPYTCVVTQTGNSAQVIQGFNERLFGKSTGQGPKCPDEDLSDPSKIPYAKGRNYWHRFNNMRDKETFAWDGTGPLDPVGTPGKKGNSLRSDDPRLVTLFFTTYESFTDTGNQVYPIVGFGNFYVTGYGESRNGGWVGGTPIDPCDDGNDSGVVGAGNMPPSDLDLSGNTIRRWVWGHFVKEVTPAPFTTGGNGELCNPDASFMPCVAVLVE